MPDKINDALVETKGCVCRYLLERRGVTAIVVGLSERQMAQRAIIDIACDRPDRRPDRPLGTATILRARAKHGELIEGLQGDWEFAP